MVLDSMDWQAAMDSEIFREYVNNELRKEAEAVAAQKPTLESMEKELDEELAANAQLEEFQKKVDASPALKEYFKRCKAALKADPSLHKKVDPKFISGVMMLDLESEAGHAEDIDLVSGLARDFSKVLAVAVRSRKADPNNEADVLDMLKAYLEEHKSEQYFKPLKNYVLFKIRGGI